MGVLPESISHPPPTTPSADQMHVQHADHFFETFDFGEVMYNLFGYNITWDHPDWKNSNEYQRYLIATFQTKQQAEDYVEKARLRHTQATGYESVCGHEYRASSKLRHYRSCEIVEEGQEQEKTDFDPKKIWQAVKAQQEERT